MYICSMKKFVMLAAVAAMPFISFAGEPASVFITAGQSNSEGRALVSEKPSYLNRGYKHLKYADVRPTQDGRFGKFKFGKTFAYCDVVNYLIDKASDKDFYAIKCTYGGTAITPGQTKEGKPVWYANAEWLAQNKSYNKKDGGMSLAKSLTEGFAKCAETTLSKLKDGYDVKAIMWHQGESDRKIPEAYYDNFKDLITYMRDQIYAVTGDEKDKTLPFIFGTVPHTSKQYSPVVEAAQFKVASELPNVYVIDLSDAGFGEDQLHFNGEWTEYVGKQMFNKLVDLDLVSAERVSVDKPAPVSDIAGQLTIYRPAQPNGKALVVCPGGGYDHHAMEHEGTRVGEWLSGEGYSCAVLNYRLPGGKSNIPTDDSRAAIRYLRAHADSLGIDAHKVGIMGFSAGGHLAASTSTLSDSLSRPDFQVLIYPVISMDEGVTHAGSRRNLIGKNPSQIMIDRFSADRQVSPTTPPAIIVLSADDTAVPPENSLRMFKALKANNVPVEMHIYPVGGHGWGMRDRVYFKPQWQAEVISWLNRI